jgi:hypothetical protein
MVGKELSANVTFLVLRRELNCGNVTFWCGTPLFYSTYTLFSILLKNGIGKGLDERLENQKGCVCFFVIPILFNFFERKKSDFLAVLWMDDSGILL